MRDIDLHMTDTIGISRVMEVVAMRTADFLTYELTIQPDTHITCVAGKGHNGGDAIAVARILHGRERNTSVIVSNDEDLSEETRHQLELYKVLGGTIEKNIPSDGILIDGLFGTGLTSTPEGKAATLIEEMNASSLPILSLDLPSGLNATTGIACSPCIKATWTLTYHVPKSGLLTDSAQIYVGELFTCETGLSFTAFTTIKTDLKDLYKENPIVRVLFL
jgi:hydroxyethylthiazole kinase-like uncharacterized protein yjeF